MGKAHQFSVPRKIVLTGILLCLAAAAGARTAAAGGRNCLFIPGIGTLQSCFVMGSCTMFDTCVGYTCDGEGTCGPNGGEECIFGGGCGESSACSASCPP